jgi:hypothetical protein
MGITHYVKARTGETYTDKNGNEKQSYASIGRLVETAGGNKVIILDSIPFAWFGAGKPVAMYLQAKDREDRQTTSVPPPADNKPAQKRIDEDDDIPFN